MADFKRISPESKTDGVVDVSRFEQVNDHGKAARHLGDRFVKKPFHQDHAAVHGLAQYLEPEVLDALTAEHLTGSPQCRTPRPPPIRPCPLSTLPHAPA